MQKIDDVIFLTKYPEPNCAIFYRPKNCVRTSHPEKLFISHSRLSYLQYFTFYKEYSNRQKNNTSIF